MGTIHMIKNLPHREQYGRSIVISTLRVDMSCSSDISGAGNGQSCSILSRKRFIIITKAGKV